MGDLEPRASSDLRIGHAERDRVAEILRQAAGDGRITLEELDQRLETTYAAKTSADLAPALDGLAQAAEQGTPGGEVLLRPGAGIDVPDSERHRAVMSGFDRSGVWTVPREFTVTAFWGGVHLDLRQAQFAAPEVVITVKAVMAGAEIIVSPQTRVILEGTGLMGSFTAPAGNTRAELTEDSPVVRVRGRAVMGGVTVYRKALRSERPK